MAIQYTPFITGTCGTNFVGSISLNLTGGSAPYTVQWITPNLGTDTGVLFSTRNGLVANDYVIRISDSTAPINDSITITIPIKDNVCCSINNVNNTTCGQSNGSVTASTNSTGSVSSFSLYTFSNQLLTSIDTTSNSIVFTSLSAGTYYVVAENIYGCTGSSESFVVNNSTQLNFGLYTVPNATCGVGNFGKIFVTGITGTPPYTYKWTNGGTGSTITGLSQGNYAVEVTDGLGCSQIQSSTVNLVDPLGLVLVTPVAPTCLQNNGSLTFQFTGGTLPYYYNSSSGVYDVSFSRTFTIPNLNSGTYTLNVTDAALCTISTTYSLSSPSGMTFVDVIITNSQCSSNNGSLQVLTQGGNPPYTYSLVYPSLETKQSTTTDTNYLFSNLSGGTYTVVLNDSSGCTFTNQYVVVTQDAFSIQTSTTGSTFGRSNGSIYVSKTSGGTQPFNYVLDGNTIFKNTSLSAVTFEGVSPGQHEVKVFDSNNCFESIQVSVESQPIVDFFLNLVSDGSESGNTLTALISGGKPPFTYIWSDNVENNPQNISVTGLTAGTYSLTVVDSNNSSMMQTKIIPSSRTLVSYGLYTVGQQNFKSADNTKYSLSKMMNEGFQDITSGNTGCILSSATFTTQVQILPFNTITTEQFYVSTSLLNSPPDNLWFDSIKRLINQTTGVQDVIIDEANNTITITSDPSRSNIIDGTTTAINIKVNLIVDYDIYCTG